MSAPQTASNSGSGLGDAGKLVTRSLEAGAALYALDHATKGTPIGAEGSPVATAARVGGNFVIVAFLWHILIVPYLIVTGVLFAAPPLAFGLLFDRGPNQPHAATAIFWLLVITFLALWVRYALYRWLYRRFIRPLDAHLSGRVLTDQARRPMNGRRP